MDHEGNELIIKFSPDDTDTAEFEQAFCGSRGRAIPFDRALQAAAIRWAIFERDTSWINDDDDPDYVFSFKSCCESLGIDYLAARTVLNQRIGKGRRVLLRRPKTLEFEVTKTCQEKIYTRLRRVPAWGNSLEVPRVPAAVQFLLRPVMAPLLAVACANCRAAGGSMIFALTGRLDDGKIRLSGRGPVGEDHR